MKKIIIYGIGNIFEIIKKYLNLDNCDVLMFTDDNSALIGTIYEGKKIIALKEINKFDYDYILIINKDYLKKMHNKLLQMGVHDTKIINIFNTSDEIVKYLFKKMQINQSFYGENNIIEQQEALSMIIDSSCSIRGFNNFIKLGKNILLNNLKIDIRGINNNIIIEESCIIQNSLIQLSGNNCSVMIGKDTTINGFKLISCSNNNMIKIGSDCMFSCGIIIRPDDGHTITDLKDKVINHSKDIIIGNHVWVAERCTILKGSRIGDNCILGANSTLTKAFNKKNIVLAGNPARIIRKKINWIK